MTEKIVKFIVLPGFLLLLLIAVCYPGYEYNVLKKHRGKLRKVIEYFKEHDESGFTIQTTNKDLPEKIRIESMEIWEWKIQQSDEDDWTECSWLVLPVNSYGINLLRDLNLPTDRWWFLENTYAGEEEILLPLTEGAYEIHKELELPLPEGFKLEMIQNMDQP